MGQIAWELRDGGQVLRIFQLNPSTRQVTLLLELVRSVPMTEADALRYMDANYPDGGAVRAAAEILGTRKDT